MTLSSFQTLSPTAAVVAAAAMKIITQLVILTLSLLLVNAHDSDDDQYCDNLYKQYKTFRSKCSPANITIDNCCDLTGLPRSKTLSAVYQMKSCIVPCKASSFTKVTTTVYCDVTTDQGGWIVIQRNRNNSLVDFNKNWTHYEAGFGDLTMDFWYGLSAMHCLTQRGQWEMRVDYQKNDKTWSYLHYNQFSVGSASEEYPLTVGGFTGVGTDHFAARPLNGMKFTTPDNDNDKSSSNCAIDNKSGWWHNNCHNININQQPPQVPSSVLFSEMKIRPKDCITQ